jgi:ABC-2 type transport system ATP-binding protein
MEFLETHDVVKQYANHLALNKVSIQVPEGKVFGLLGPNGAGKTTLIRIINRITAPDSGSVYFDGRLSEPNDIYQIGYMPEERGLYKKMKVGEQAIFLAQLKGLSYKDAKARLTGWFEKFDIMPWWNKKVEELSKGMQQKIQFVTTVIHEPRLLIFDEPFSGFDPVNAELLKKEILELKKKGHTIIFSTHNMASVEEICDEIALINKSKMVLSGEVNEIKNRFKTHNFVVKVANGDTIASIDGVFDVLPATEERFKQDEIRIHKYPETSKKALFDALTNQADITYFSEEIPSMNEIFIHTVTPQNSTLA